MSSKLLQDSFDGIEGVYGRRLRLCSYLESHETSDLILSCSHCSHFYLLCCSCRKSYRPCHRYRLVFTDGACRNNGQTGATAGIGIAYGTDEQSQIVLPISDKLDNFPRRTSQRAELLAALKGLSQVCENDTPLINDSPGGYLIIATDSEYVVNGITQWFPRWKANNWRNAGNCTPANLDLFQKLDAAIITEEHRHGVTIGFWHISRQYNHLADGLAKRAAEFGDPA